MDSQPLRSKVQSCRKEGPTLDSRSLLSSKPKSLYKHNATNPGF